MVMECDNDGSVDITNNWSSTGRTRHIDVRLKFLRELKEANILRMVWCPTQENETDIFTKNTTNDEFGKHIKKFVGVDEYVKNG